MLDNITTTENHVDINSNTDSFSNLVWQSGPKGTWYLDKRVCKPSETNTDNETEFINFDIVNEDKPEEETIFNENDRIVYEGKIHLACQIESNDIYIKLSEEAEKFLVPISSIGKFLKFNFLIIGKTKILLIENINININNDVSYIKEIISEYLSLPKEIFSIYFKSQELPLEKKLFELEIQEGDAFAVTFLQSSEELIQRSASKDYTWSDRKNLIPFTVDKNIILSAIGFFKEYDVNITAIYDFMLYEVSENGEKKLISSLSNVSVKSDECDVYFVKKVSISPTLIKANLKYYAYVYFKGSSEMRTYFSYSGNSELSVKGMKVKFFDVVEPEHKTSTTSGHLPYMYFKFDNPYSK